MIDNIDLIELSQLHGPHCDKAKLYWNCYDVLSHHENCHLGDDFLPTGHHKYMYMYRSSICVLFQPFHTFLQFLPIDMNH